MNLIFPHLISNGKATLTLDGYIDHVYASDLFDDACELACRPNVVEVVIDLGNVHSVHPLIVAALLSLKQEIERNNVTFFVKYDVWHSPFSRSTQDPDQLDDLLPLPSIPKQNSYASGVTTYV